ncbi:RAD55 family ATPase, partial [Massilia genomosp. 1]
IDCPVQLGRDAIARDIPIQVEKVLHRKSGAAAVVCATFRLDDLIAAVERSGATRVVIDSLSEVSLYLAPEFQSDYRSSVFRILAGLARLGVTVVVTMGLDDRYTELRFSQADTGFLADAIVAMRYVEIEGTLAKVMSVVKVRGSAHSTDLRRYTIDAGGLRIEPRALPYTGLLSGCAATIVPPG